VYIYNYFYYSCLQVNCNSITGQYMLAQTYFNRCGQTRGIFKVIPMLNYYLSQQFKLIKRDKFNHLINTLTPVTMLHLPIFNCSGDWRVIHIKKLNLLSNMVSYIKLKRHEKKKKKKSKGILYREMSLLIFILIIIGKDGDVFHSFTLIIIGKLRCIS
jgi:hypothetical protein